MGKVVVGSNHRAKTWKIGPLPLVQRGRYSCFSKLMPLSYIIINVMVIHLQLRYIAGHLT